MHTKVSSGATADGGWHTRWAACGYLLHVLILAGLLTTGLAAISDGIAGGFSVFQLSITPRLQLIPEASTLVGLRLTLPYGRNANLYGLDIGGVNSVSGTAVGIQAAVGANRGARMRGIQLAGVANFSDDCRGVQVSALGVNYAARLRGIQIGSGGGGIERASGESLLASNVAVDAIGLQLGLFGNYARRRMIGVQIGGANFCDGTATGIQLAVLGNRAARVRGIQIGCLNQCERLMGIQIGIANIVRDRRIPVLPILNAGFAF